MDSVLIIVVALLLLPLLAVIYHRIRPIPHIPGPPWHSYLPGQPVFEALWNRVSFNRLMVGLAARYGPIFQIMMGPTHFVITSDPDDMRQIMTSSTFTRDPHIISVMSRLAPDGIFTREGPRHLIGRRQATVHFNLLSLPTFSRALLTAADGLRRRLDKLVPNEGWSDAVVIGDMIASTTLQVIFAVAFHFDLSDADADRVTALVDCLVEGLMTDFTIPLRPELSRRGFYAARRELTSYIGQLIEKRREPESQDPLRPPDVLDDILAENPIETAINLALEFSLAGSHTTGESIAWCLYETCCNERVMKELERDVCKSNKVTFDTLEEMRYLQVVWKESLRYHAVIGGSVRATKEEVVLRGSGVSLPAGTRVMAHFMRAMRDPAHWGDAEMFRPERWDEKVPNVFVPFAVGPKSCPGRFLANAEGPLILATLHRNFRFKLDCAREDVVSTSCFVETPRCPSMPGGPADSSLRVRMQRRQPR